MNDQSTEKQNKNYQTDSAGARLLFPFSEKKPVGDVRPKFTAVEPVAEPLPIQETPQVEKLIEPQLFVGSYPTALLQPEEPKIPSGKPTLNPFRNAKTREQLLVYAVVLLIAGVSLHFAAIIIRTSKIKSAVLGATTAGLAALGKGQSLVVNQQFADSVNSFNLAQTYFLQGKLDIKSEGQLTAALISVTPQGQDAERILDAGNNISAAGSSLANLSAASKGISISAAGFSGANGLHQSLDQIDADAADAQQHLQTAQADLAAVNISSVPEANRSQLTTAAQQIQTYTQTLTEMRGLISLAEGFFSEGPQTILVLFENNNELRPGGGFIGTYGLYHVQDGKVTMQKISSIYDLDGQLSTKKKIAPPGEFATLTDSWGLRDSNWFADFRTNAQKASSFYELEGRETPDAVIAITPDLFENLLRITGPIQFPKYNLVLTADNFRQAVQLGTSDKTSATPKQMLADFAPLLLQKISGLPSGGNTAIANAVLDNLKRKNILAYTRDSNVEQRLIAANWAGSLANTNKDYLEVSAANLGGQKTDLHIKQSLQLDSQVQSDNSIVNTITYARSHDDIANDPINSSFVRFVVPAGSTILSATGFTHSLYFKANGSAYSAFESMQNFSIDPDLAKIDSSVTIDQNSGTVSAIEDGKTTFGNWMVTSPGQAQRVTISYLLPFAFDRKSQSLIVQKQPGATNIDFSYNFSNATGTAQLPGILWYTPNNAQTSGKAFSVQSSIQSDQIFGAVFGN